MRSKHGMIFKVLVVTALLLLAFSGQIFAQDLETPELTSPKHGKVVAGETVELQWEAPDEADAYAVVVWKLTEGEFEIIVENELTSDNSYTVEELSDEGDIYAWTVTAGDTQVPGKWSDYAVPIVFVNGTDKDLLPPTLTSPEHLSKVEGTSVELEWEAPDGADAYALVVWMETEEGYEIIVENELVAETSYTLEETADDGDIYVWSVAAGDTQVPDEWSDFAFPWLFVNGDETSVTVSGTEELTEALGDEAVKTIILEDGEYVGQFLVQYPQTIKAENPNEAIIKLPENNLEKAHIAERMRTWVIRVHDVEDVTIQGLTICGGDGAPEKIDEEEVHLLGIVYDDASGTIEGNIVQNIRRSEPGAAGNYFSYNKGILVDGATGDTSILDNTVYLHEYGRLAITVGKSQEDAAVTIEGNKVFGVGDNMVHNWLHSGITVIDVAGAVCITDNDLTDIQSARENSVGIFVISVDGISGEITIQNNRITETQFGIRIWETGNPITGDLVISDNAIYDNIYYGVYNDSDTVIDARNNWWGDAGGPSGDVNDPETGETADGDGDRINENVRFDPWYIDEDMETLSGE